MIELVVRPATPDDVPSLFAMKRQLVALEGTENALRATAADWLRDGFGPNARFTAVVAEFRAELVGMATFSERYYTGWAGFGLYIQDMFVDPRFRRHGVATTLLSRVAAHAVERDCPLIELTVEDDNTARKLYRRVGFRRVERCSTYVIGAGALADLAEFAR